MAHMFVPTQVDDVSMGMVVEPTQVLPRHDSVLYYAAAKAGDICTYGN